MWYNRHRGLSPSSAPRSDTAGRTYPGGVDGQERGFPVAAPDKTEVIELASPAFRRPRYVRRISVAGGFTMTVKAANARRFTPRDAARALRALSLTFANAGLVPRLVLASATGGGVMTDGKGWPARRPGARIVEIKDFFANRRRHEVLQFERREGMVHSHRVPGVLTPTEN